MLLPKASVNPKEGAIAPRRVELPTQRDFPRIHLDRGYIGCEN